MPDNFNFPIPNEVLEPYIKEAVSTSIVAALGDGSKLIQLAVQEALRSKVSSDGTFSRSSYENKYPLVETIAKNKINEIARDVIHEMAEQMRPKIIEAVKEDLKKNNTRLAEAMVNGLIESIVSKWSVSVKFYDED